VKSSEDIIRFWFVEHGQADWWGGKPEFDAEIDAQFRETHERVSKGEGFAWRATAEGRLAEIIVLDQLSRQLYRGKARAFAQDGMALVLAQELVAQGLDRELSAEKSMFAYMPYIHAESLVVHDEALRMFTTLGRTDLLGYEGGHRTCIERFGRFPKRNAVLGRVSTPEELDYIANTKGVF
jgi:uncharacterized protein (DUF924 family)